MTSIRRTLPILGLAAAFMAPSAGRTQTAEPAATPPAADEAPAASTERLTSPGTSHASRSLRVDIQGTLGFWPAALHGGGGAWAGVPVMPEGILPGINDALAVEAGLRLEYYRWRNASCTQSWTRATPLLGARWEVFLTEDWTLFANLKAGWGFGFWKSFICTSAASEAEEPNISSFAWDAALGAYFQVEEGLSLRIDAGYRGLGAGVSLEL